MIRQRFLPATLLVACFSGSAVGGHAVQMAVNAQIDGSVTAPSCTWASMNTTGFYKVAANSPGLAVNGVAAWSWDSSGNYTAAAGQNLTMGSGTLGLATATVSGTPTWSSSQAITLSTAAQPNVTSLGTLTGLTVNGTLSLSNGQGIVFRGATATADGIAFGIGATYSASAPLLLGPTDATAFFSAGAGATSRGITWTTQNGTESSGGAMTFTTAAGITASATAHTGGSVTFNLGAGEGASGGGGGAFAVNGGNTDLVSATANGGGITLTAGKSTGGFGSVFTIFGGQSSTTSGGYTLAGGLSVGTDLAGGAVTIAGTRSTGNATGSQIQFQTCPRALGAASGSGNNSVVNTFRLDASQNDVSGTRQLALLNGTFADGGTNSSGEIIGFSITPTVNMTGGTKSSAVSCLKINLTETSAPTGTLNLARLQTGGVDKFTVSDTGTVTTGIWNAGAITTSGGVSPSSNGTGTLGAASTGFAGLYVDYTNSGTVGNVTINKAAGRCNLAAAGTTLTVTNSKVTAASHVFLNPDSAPGNAVAVLFYAVPAAGSFTVNAVPAVTNQTAIDFFVVNAD